MYFCFKGARKSDLGNADLSRFSLSILSISCLLNSLSKCFFKFKTAKFQNFLFEITLNSYLLKCVFSTGK